MYQLAVKRDFVAQHFLIGGDWGPENKLHSHHYQVEVVLEGDSLDQHGYLVDIVEVEQNLEDLVDRYRDVTLNDLPEFDNLNPSLEHFARLFSEKLGAKLSADNITRMRLKIWENEIAWAAYQLDLS